MVAVAVVVAAALPTVARAQEEEAAAHSWTRGRGSYLDRSGRPVAWQRAYDLELAPLGPPRYLRAAAEQVVLLGFGTLWYWFEADLNSEDWDLPYWVDRLNFEAVRFDNNRFVSNMLQHPIAGSGYYGFARVNGLNVVESFAYALASSSIWEYVLEFREKVSINDQFMTPVGGVALGETFFQLGRYLNSGGGDAGWGADVAAVTLGFPVWAHYLAEGGAHTPIERDSLGLSAGFDHRFELRFEPARISHDGGWSGIWWGGALDGRIVALPGWLRPGELDVFFADGNIVEGSLWMAVDESGLRETVVRSRALIAGWLSQRVREDASGGTHGIGLVAAAATSFDYVDRELPGFVDRWGASHLFGPAFELHAVNGALRVSLTLDGSVDFAGVSPVAWDAWIAQGDRDLEGIKTVLANKQYYFAFGFSARSEARLQYRGLELGARASHGSYDSVEGLDRFEEDVTDDVNGVDDVTELETWIGYTPPGALVTLRIGAGRFARWGALDDVEVSRRHERVSAGVGLRF